ncbi:PTS system beta-glucosides-specific IIC component [Lactobacillus colini]|uniref:PTS system beta-glucosides-specific IIC component n=1 Tax=Lactobacillus colini TaxID=1819254 RepID=A0ABS4MFS5_9LACO|nr:beta-glucoside-specific PTS transporter subunit IIABC [Lactobacillus colini]MBP2058540.1 PTS system beta-glucosides-specific IIC component [Lactobacillus colini]
MNWDTLAKNIIDAVGGPSNIKNATHCATRLRLTLYDDSKAQQEKIGNFEKVLGVVNQGGQLQIIIGNDVPVLYDSFINIYQNGSSSNQEEQDEKSKSTPKKGLSDVLDIISGIFIPVIPAMAGAGLLKAFLIVISMLGLISKTSQTFLILNFVSDTAFYFLPILLAHSASVKLNTNPYLSMVIGAMLINPVFIQMVQQAVKTHSLIKLFGLPVTPTNYSSSVVPVLLAIWVMSYIEPTVNKLLPKVLRLMFTPLIVLVIMTPLTFIVIAPIGAWLGDGLANIIAWINNYAGWSIPLIIGALSPLLVMTGMHYALISVAINNLAKVGWENLVGPGMLVSNIAQGGAVLAVATRTKDKKLKALGISTGLSAILGITEPALYGINLRYRRPLISAMIGGGLGGLFLGIMGIRRFQQVPPSLLALPSFIGNSISNLWFAIIGVVIAFVASYVIQLFLGLPKELRPEADKVKQQIIIDAPLAGEIEKLSDVNDVVFSQEMLGKGIAIFPKDGKVYSPIKGEVRVFNSDTKHAIGISGDNGVDLLIHCGLDTVKLNGEGFTGHIKQGDKVKRGDLLLEMDYKLISSQGYDPITMVLVTNHDKFNTVQCIAHEDVRALDKLLKVE